MKVLVIGAGVIGLTTAVVLARRGARVTIWARDVSPRTLSDRAGAKFTPFGTGGPPRERRWVEASMRAFSALAADHAKGTTSLPHGVFLGRAREYVADASHARPWWADLVKDFTPFVPPPESGFVAGFDQTVPHMDVSLYMPWLTNLATQLGVNIERRNLDSLAPALEQPVDAVINCTGLGASSLVPDALVRPMRGQMVRATNTTNLRTSLIADRPDPELAKVPGSGIAPGGLAITYIFAFPRHLILGGTFEPGVADEHPDPVALDAIVDRCRQLARLAGHEGWRDIGIERERQWAGLRPARLRADSAELLEDIRLEEDLATGPRHKADTPRLIHNYGHGRAGVTLSWGCAEDVVSQLMP